MEDDDNEQGLIRSWMKHVSFSFKSLLTRQIVSAISGLLVNFLVTKLITWFLDVDFRFRSRSVKWVLLVLSLVSVLLAFVFRYFLIKLRSVDWYSSPTGMAADMGGGGDGMDNGGEQISTEYTVFTSFRFPVPDNLLPGPQRLPVAEDTTATVSSLCTEPSRLSPSLSELRPPPPPPSYQPQWVTSIPTTTASSSSSHQRFMPSAPPSPNKGKGKLRSSSSRQTTRLKNMNPKTCLLHQSLLHPTNVIPRQKSLVKNPLHNTSRNTDRTASSSSSSKSRSWAWEFMEKASFDQFKRDYANFRNINSSLLGAFATDTLRAEASRWIKGRVESDTNEGQKARVSSAREDHHQLLKPAPATAPVLPPAFLQAVTPEVNPGVKKMVERKTKCAGCLKTFMPSFCFQRRKREQRRWNSRRFRQISHAPLLWSPIHPPITTTMTSPPTIRCM